MKQSFWIIRPSKWNCSQRLLLWWLLQPHLIWSFPSTLNYSRILRNKISNCLILFITTHQEWNLSSHKTHMITWFRSDKLLVELGIQHGQVFQDWLRTILHKSRLKVTIPSWPSNAQTISSSKPKKLIKEKIEPRLIPSLDIWMRWITFWLENVMSKHLKISWILIQLKKHWR